MILLRPDLALVLSGSLGCDLSDSFDCNAVAFDTGDGWAMVDAGAGRDPDALVAAVGSLPLRWLLLTHAHADHSGGAAALRERPGCTVVAGPETAALLRAGEPRGIGLTHAKEAGVYPLVYVWRGCEVDVVAGLGTPLVLGSRTIDVIASPGHSGDHICYRLDDVLCAGDALFAGGRVALQDLPDSSIPDTCATVRVLAALEFDAFLPGHGPFSLTRGHRHAMAALNAVGRMLGIPTARTAYPG